MNDWLDYKGSGSIRSNNTISHADGYSRLNGPTMTYDSINKELDALYNEMQTQVSRQKKLNAELNSFINAAQKLKAASVIGQTGLRALNNRADSINSKINSFYGSSLQKTALKNKLDSIVNKYDSTIPSLTRLPSSISLDTLNTVIDEINQNSKSNHR